MKFKPHHAAFTVNNINESIKWYQKKLGFKVTHQYNKLGSERAIMELDEVRLELFNFEKETLPLPDYRKELFNDLHVQGIKHLCIEVEDLDKIIKSLNKMNVETRKVDTAGFGGRFTFIKDCNGILIELYQR